MAATPNTPIQEVFRQRPEGGEFSPLCSEGEKKNHEECPSVGVTRRCPCPSGLRVQRGLGTA